MAKSFKVTIHRYEKGREPASYVQTYELTHESRQTVLEILVRIRNEHDDSLSFRSSCEAAKCGSCAVQLDGRPVLACRTTTEGDDIEIKPLPNFPVVKDLIVDREKYEQGFVKTLLYDKDTVPSEPPPALLPESQIDYANLSCCIGCLVCNAACPVAAQMGDEFPNPAVITEVLSAGVRSQEENRIGAPVEKNIDYCSLCLNCHAACPSGVKLNRINASSKGAYVEEKGLGFRDKMLTRAETAGKIGSLLPSLSNALMKTPIIRSGLESAVGISKKGDMVPFSKPLKSRLSKDRVTKPSRPKRRIVYFAGCYSRFNDSDPGEDAMVVMEHLGFDIELPTQHCCGLPMIGSGDMDGAKKLAKENIALLKPWADKGYDILTSCTSCSMMLKHEYDEVLKIGGAEAINKKVYDLGQYLRQLLENQEISFHLHPVAGNAAYHTPCHLKAQKIGLPFIDILKTIPTFKVDVMNAPCCGQSGSYGLKKEKYDVSQKVSRTLTSSLAELDPDIALSECGPCQVRMHGVSGLPVAHPVSILRKALEPDRNS